MCPLDGTTAIWLRKQAVNTTAKQVCWASTGNLDLLHVVPVLSRLLTFYISCFGTLNAPWCLCQEREKDAECRVFQDKWSASSWFKEMNGKDVRLVADPHTTNFKDSSEKVGICSWYLFIVEKLVTQRKLATFLRMKLQLLKNYITRLNLWKRAYRRLRRSRGLKLARLLAT